jgi:hypothetical protein
LQQRLQRIDAVPQALIGRAVEAVGVRRWNKEGLKQQRMKNPVEQLDPADADRADGIAVVRVPQRDEFRPAIGAAVVPVLIRHLHRDLDGRGAAVGIEHPRQARRCDTDQPPGQFDRSGLAQAQQRAVRDAVELLADRPVDGAGAVAVHIAPQRADAVDVAAAFGVDQLKALAGLDDQGIARRPRRHLRERMPQMPAVGVDKLLSSFVHIQ